MLCVTPSAFRVEIRLIRLVSDCGNAVLYAYGASQACDVACSGNTSEFCGGPDALNLYQFDDIPFTTGPPSTVFVYKTWEWWGCMEYGIPRMIIIMHG